MTPIRVIIAEDHALVREGTRRLLEQHKDVEVVGEAENGEEAVALAEKLRPDVAIMDIAMPGVNGIEATRRIRARCPTTSVLMLTAYDDDQYIFALLEAGAAGYLLKSVRGSELVEALRAIHAGESVLHPAVTRKVLRSFLPSKAADQQRGGVEALTEREQEVLRLAARGLSNKGIAQELALSTRTVQVHLSRIFGKLGVASRTEAVIFGLRQGWFRLEDL